MVPKLRTGLFTVVALVFLLALVSQTASASTQNTTRQLAAVQVQVMSLHKQQYKSRTVVNFWHHRGRWALAPRYKQCSQVVGNRRQRVCHMARHSLAFHARRLTSVHQKLASLMPWANDLRRTYAYRQCLIEHESAMTTSPYKAENGGTRWVEGNGHSDASGAYQFLDGTWKGRFASAKAYYGSELNGSWTHAADAPPWVQDVVTAYSILDKSLRGRDWTHPDCRVIPV